MQNIAEAADVGVATVYRHFSTVEEMLNGVLLRRIEELEKCSDGSQYSGTELFHQIVEAWFKIISRDGELMVQARSRRGFLARLQEGDPVISAVERAWSRPIAELMRSQGLMGVSNKEALYFFNVLFDPRDVLDLISLGEDARAVQQRLIAVYQSTLVAWSTSS